MDFGGEGLGKGNKVDRMEHTGIEWVTLQIQDE